MSDHPLYRAILEAAVWPYCIFVLWLIFTAIRQSIRRPHGPKP